MTPHVFFCAPLVSTRGGALDLALHSQSQVVMVWFPLAFLRDHLAVEPRLLLCFAEKDQKSVYFLTAKALLRRIAAI